MTGGPRVYLFTPDDITRELTRLNLHAAAEHHPDSDGRCPICPPRRRYMVCDAWVSAVRALRAAGVAVPVMPPHEPTRPGWHCESCDEPWPCAQARVMLGEQHGPDDRPGLRVYMAGLLEKARTELPRVPEGELQERFVAWTTPYG